MSDTESYRDVFLAESAEYLQLITDGLLRLESAPHDLEPVEEIFRGAHSLKGMSAAMNYVRTADLTHRMESLMDRVRKNEIAATADVISLMLAAVDLAQDLIADEANGREVVDPAEMNAALQEMASVPSVQAPGREAGDSAVEEHGEGNTWLVTVRLEGTCVLKSVRAYMVIKRLSHMGEVLETHPSAQEIEDERFESEFEVVVTTPSSADEVRAAAEFVSEVEAATVEAYTAHQAPSASGLPAEEEATESVRAHRPPKLTETQTVRISIDHLDTLIDLVGELVILRSRLERIAEHTRDEDLAETVGELQSISTELQYEVMRTRMVPVGNIFNRFPRMVRDLAVDLGKQVDFRMDGCDIELDRTVLDEIGDPLVHLLRNSLDHGLESPEERVARGKPPEGIVTLSASRERDHVAIVVSDDGRGIDIERVWSKAVATGLVASSERPDYDDSAILQFTCVPGFSTAEATTRISGRGVGLDVVKGKIEYLGGTLKIRSRFGHGTDFVLRLPMTLAIIQALLVETRGHEFAVPLSAVEEVFAAEDVDVDTVDGMPVVIARDGSLVPLYRLDALLFGHDPRTLPEPKSHVVLLQAGAELRALHVDALAGRREIVVKPLSPVFRDQRGFSGATVLGDGRVMLIIDPRVLAVGEGRE